MFAKLWEASGVGLRRAGRSPDPARDRAPRREAAPAHERDVILDPSRPQRSPWRRRGATRRSCASPGSAAPRHRRAAAARWRRRAGAGADPRLTAGDAVAHAYDAILDADFDRLAGGGRRRRAPPAPKVACLVLDALGRRGGRSSLDPESRRSTSRSTRGSTRRSLRRSAGPRREPRPRRGVVLPRRGATARACSGGCCAKSGSRRRATASASRRRSSGRCSSTRALHDAKFGIGMYRYYADDRARGLPLAALAAPAAGRRTARGARADPPIEPRCGQLVRGEADYQTAPHLPLVRGSAAEALDLVLGLQARYPRNPLFRQIEAEIHDVYFHDAAAA